MTTSCKHFQGMHENDTCEAGVKYTDVQKDHEPVPYRSHRGTNYTSRRSFPCFPVGTGLNHGGATCEKCVFPTAEEQAAEEAEHRKMFADSMKARAAIVASLGGPWKRGMKGAGGAIHCPICDKPGETLRFSRAGINGHIHANCPGCVAWME